MAGSSEAGVAVTGQRTHPRRVLRTSMSVPAPQQPGEPKRIATRSSGESFGPARTLEFQLDLTALREPHLSAGARHDGSEPWCEVTLRAPRAS